MRTDDDDDPVDGRRRPSIPSEVSDAALSLETSARSFVDRQRRRRPQKKKREKGGLGGPSRAFPEEEGRRAVNLAGHGGHVLRTLTLKRMSLRLGVRALSRCAESCLDAVGRAAAAGGRKSAPESPANDPPRFLQSALTGWFASYLRVRDGLVLLTSGECRHPADSALALLGSNPYPSSLGSGGGSGLRDDGYTSLFSSRMGYSGYGWDEFFDEDEGIRRRMADALLLCAGSGPTHSGRAKVWEKLCDAGAEVFEAQMDHHESVVKAATTELEGVADRFVGGINTILVGRDGRGRRRGGGGGGRIVLTSTDKFERLEMRGSFLGVTDLVIERRGDDFRVDDDGGVLPSDWDGSRWDAAMSLPESARHSSPLCPPSSRRGGGERRGDGTLSKADASAGEATTTAAAAAARRKKRRIIVDDSDEDDEGDGINIGGCGSDRRPPLSERASAAGGKEQRATSGSARSIKTETMGDSGRGGGGSGTRTVLPGADTMGGGGGGAQGQGEDRCGLRIRARGPRQR